MSAPSLGKYVGGRERLGPRGKDVLGEAISSTLQNLGTAFGQDKKRQNLMRTAMDPNSSPLQKSLALGELGHENLGVGYLKAAIEEQNKGALNQYKSNLENEIANLGKTAPNPNQQTQENIPNTGSQGILDRIYGKNTQQPPQQPEQVQKPNQIDPLELKRQKADRYEKAALDVADKDPALAAKYSNLANQERQDIRTAEKVAGGKYQADVLAGQKAEKLKRDIFESERDYNTKLSQDFSKTISGIRQSLPKKEMALNLAETAIESDDLGALSRNNLADIIGRPELKNASGAALDLALKENLLGNLSRVSARANNKWLEQVAFNAFPRAALSKESNLTVQEALRADEALDQAMVQAYNELAEQDMKKQNYVGGDIEQRTFKALEPISKDIMDRLSYRSRVLYEKEKGKKALFGLANKKAPRGTPLTRQMYQVFLKKTGDEVKAIERAKRLGYVIYPNSKVQEFTQ